MKSYSKCSPISLIINGIRAIGRDVPKIKLVNKILCSLQKSMEAKVTVILEAKDLTKLELDQLIGSLTTQR